MPQLDVYRNRGKNPEISYLLDVQSDLFSGLRTRVVVPLIPIARAPRAIERLNPIFEIEGEAYVMVTPELAGVETSSLGEKVVSLSGERDAIIQALDFLFLGF